MGAIFECCLSCTFKFFILTSQILIFHSKLLTLLCSFIYFSVVINRGHFSSNLKPRLGKLNFEAVTIAGLLTSDRRASYIKLDLTS